METKISISILTKNMSQVIKLVRATNPREFLNHLIIRVTTLRENIEIKVEEIEIIVNIVWKDMIRENLMIIRRTIRMTIMIKMKREVQNLTNAVIKINNHRKNLKK